MVDSLLVAMSALQTHKQAMEVTSHNIANATTPGYSRQRAELSAPQPEDTTPGQIGRGVNIIAIRRIADQLLSDRLRQTDSEVGRLTTVKDNLREIEQVFGEPGTSSLSSITNSLFAAFEDLSNNPESAALRSATVEQLKTWTSTVSQLSVGVNRLNDDLSTELGSQITKANALASDIAALNQQIRSQTAQGNSPNDLLDRREQQLRELSGLMGVRLRVQPDGGVLADANGNLFIGQDSATAFRLGSSADGSVQILNGNGAPITISGGSIGGLMELHNIHLPAVSTQLNTLVTTVVKSMNAEHSVGTSQAFRASGFTSEVVIPKLLTTANLDSASLAPISVGAPGVPAAYAPSYTDSNGTVVARNLTINVLDPVTGVAVKHSLRYDPAVGTGGRSLDDLVTAINSGRGGGFTVYPPDAGGVNGVTARRVSTDGGYRLELTAANGKSVDFSAALDTRPSATAWTGGTVSVTGTAAPAISASRISIAVQAGGTQLAVSYRDPTTGATTAIGTVAIPNAGSSTVAVGGFSVTVPAGTYRDGDRFGVDLTAGGAVSGVTVTTTATWTASDATVTIKGRYTGTQSFDPATPWSMRVIASGVIGAKASAAAPNNPPVVQFTYYDGDPASPTQHTITKTLDSALPAGAALQIADGVYVVLGAGALTAAGNSVNFTVDGQPDQAGLLPALGINTMFSGSDARTLKVTDRLAADSSQFAVGHTRAEGDNTALLAITAVRKAALFNNRSFTMDDYYQATVSSVGVQIQQASRMQENQQSVQKTLENRRQQDSGISIDEEVGQLILQQQSYSAAAKVVSIARENITTLLDILR